MILVSVSYDIDPYLASEQIKTLDVSAEFSAGRTPLKSEICVETRSRTLTFEFMTADDSTRAMQALSKAGFRVS